MSSSRTETSLAEGSVFLGRYRIVRCLAAGGMGAVYECEHITTEKRRALKVMLPHVLGTAGMRERFELEARVTAKIESEHIVETFDAGVDDATGAPFLVMELLRGEDLEEIMGRNGPFSGEETVTLLSQAARALDKTHAAGIVHRDLKPQNLFLTTRDDGSPRLKILDFGIAKLVADSTKTSQQTAAIGTPVFMAPEQATGEGTIGPPADLYALAHIAFSMLTGRPYWLEEQGDLPMYGFISRMIMGPGEPASLRAGRYSVELPAAFDAWFLRATARSPGDRFDKASTQIAELATILGASPSRLSRPSRTSFPMPTQILATGDGRDGMIASARTGPGGSRPSLASPASIAQSRGTTPLPASAPGSAAFAHAPPTKVSAAPAPSESAGKVGGTMIPLVNEPIPPLPVSSRAPIAMFAVFGVLVVALGGFGLSRGTRGAASAPVTAPTVTASGVAVPPVVVASAAPAATEVVRVEPAATGSAAVTPVAQTAPVPPAMRPSDRATKKADPPPAKPTASPKAPSNCNPPFTLDANGIKHAKPECT